MRSIHKHSIKKLQIKFLPLLHFMTAKLDIFPINQWMNEIDRPLIIGGPCSAETEEQVLTIARALKKSGKVSVYRAGIWKPRTRPNYFEGVGEKGLQWLQKVKSETGMKTTVEVASPQHVEQCLKHGIDMLWIGARTVVNPFSVQEIAEALQGVDIPVLIKNPVNPDIKLWVGAIERMNQSGINKIIAVHRGFYTTGNKQFRNPPVWEIPIELKRIIPNIPVLVDPSHICGNTENIPFIAQKAMDLEMDGLMIEVHHKPKEALSDPDQQLTPDELEKLLKELVIREKSGDKEFENKLTELRTQIDEIDGDLLQILGKRMQVVSKIGEYKKDHKITILQLKRWSHIIEDRLKTGISNGLEKDFLLQLLELLHTESMRIQTEILNS